MLKTSLLTLSFALLSLVGCFLPLSSKGGYGVDIQVLIDFIPFSQVSVVAPLLYFISGSYFVVALLDFNGRLRDAIPWYLVISVMGLSITAISTIEAISHIELFGNICTSVPQLSTASGPTGPSIGAYLLLFSYFCGLLISLSVTVKKDI